MKNVQIPYNLFMALLWYHLVEDGSCTDEIRQGLEKKLDNCTQNIRQRQRKKKEKKPEKNIWIGGECRTASAGSFSFGDN